MIRTLFVDDEVDVLEGLENRLRRLRRRWKMSFAVGGAAALEKLSEEPFDVIVSDMRMPGMDGAELLSRVRKDYPHIVRVVLSGQTKYEQVLRALPVAHHLLSKPCDSKVLQRSVERAQALHERLGRAELRDVISSLDTLPSLPGVYADITAAVEQPETSLAEIGEIVERDIAMTARLLQVVNSSFFGVGREMTTAHEAVSYLGLNAVRAIVLNVELFAALQPKRLGRGYSLDVAQEHALLTGQIAMRLLDDDAAARVAFSAGMLHDLGDLILASAMPDAYTECTEYAERESAPRFRAETEVHGLGHAEIGAALLGLWGLPYSIVEGVAYHHDPSACAEESFGVVGAVHVANYLAHAVAHQQRADDDEESSGAELDHAYLTRVGVVDRLPAWRAMAKGMAPGEPADG